MGIERIPNTDLTYYLVNFHADGRERRDDPDGLMSERLALCLRDDPISDVFLLAHAWMDDIPTAREKYNEWISAAASCGSDLDQMRRKRRGFLPLMVGLHWPSLPFTEDEFGGMRPFGSECAVPVDELMDRYAERIADTPAAREALRVIIESALEDTEPPDLPPEVHAAYCVLDREARLGGEGAAGRPGTDREPFDPDFAYGNARVEAENFNGSILSGILSPLVQLSFWKMKDRACSFGESGGHALLSALLRQSQERGVRFHLMGHSFGCIAISASAAGPAGSRLPRPVDSLMLAQGALSLWSYCDSIPFVPEKAGYFRRVLEEKNVAGPVVATISEHDTAAGKLYPLAAGVAGRLGYAPEELPEYGAVGAFGLRGTGLDLADLELRTADEDLPFAPGKVYNLDCSRVIRKGNGASGAHNDIAHPEVAHAFWSAAMATL